MELVREAFGRTEDGREAVLYHEEQPGIMEVSVTDYGAALYTHHRPGPGREACGLRSRL